MSWAITAQHGGGNPVVRLTDQPLGDLLRIERFVGFADGLDDGVAMLEPSPEGTDAVPLAGPPNQRVGFRGRRATRREASRKSVSPMATAGGSR